MVLWNFFLCDFCRIAPPPPTNKNENVSPFTDIFKKIKNTQIKSNHKWFYNNVSHSVFQTKLKKNRCIFQIIYYFQEVMANRNAKKKFYVKRQCMYIIFVLFIAHLSKKENSQLNNKLKSAVSVENNIPTPKNTKRRKV